MKQHICLRNLKRLMQRVTFTYVKKKAPSTMLTSLAFPFLPFHVSLSLPIFTVSLPFFLTIAHSQVIYREKTCIIRVYCLPLSIFTVSLLLSVSFLSLLLLSLRRQTSNKEEHTVTARIFF